MTGQSTQRPAARSAERAVQPPPQRGVQGHAHTHTAGQAPRSAGRPAPHGTEPRGATPRGTTPRGTAPRSTAPRPAGGRGGRLPRPQAGWVLLALPLLGALVDEVSGAPLGGFFLVCSVLASAWAALLVTRSGLWWVVPSPPLVIAAVAFVDLLLLHGSDFAGDKLGTGLLKWSVGLFPAMFFALLAAAAAPALRRVLTRHLAARAAGRGAEVPVPRRSHHG